MLKRFTKWAAVNRRTILAESFCVAGLIALGSGLWLKAPWLSLTVVGALVFAVGIMGSMNSGEDQVKGGPG